jgi:uncharacterized protein (TIGR03792 family)
MKCLAVEGVNGWQNAQMSHDVAAGMVIEELHFSVDPVDQPTFLEVERRVWTGFLRTCDGFIRKETWVPDDDPATVVVMIWWNTMAQWKSITQQQCEAVDAQMGEWLRPISFARAHHIRVVDEAARELP